MAVVAGRVRLSPRVKKELTRARRDDKWLNSLPLSYLRKFAGKYVAVKDKKIVAAGSTMTKLYRRLDDLGVGMAVIARIEKPALLVYFEPV